MKISEHFNLDKSQYELDFINIDTTTDLPLFIDPYFLSIRNDNWSINATRTIRSFFSHFLYLVQNGFVDDARIMFSYLHEPNETCLGMSRGTPSGRGIGSQQADNIYNSIIQSRAISTGLLEDFSDTRIFVDNVGKDKISDMTTNIIRLNLIRYTQDQCKLLKIPLNPNIPTGDFWDNTRRRWINTYDDMLIIDGKKILLVPKSIVSYSKKYTPENYTQHFVLNYLQQEHLQANSPLVQHIRRKDGSERVFVTKKSIKASSRLDKDYLIDFTLNHRDVFQNFKLTMKSQITNTPQHEYSPDDIYAVIDHLIASLQNTEAGTNDATRYHRIVTGILELIFYPQLTSPIIEQEIHSGRKRIDITFDNASESGFFYRLSSLYNIPSSFIHVECKNYSRDIANPELDQISGRFSPNRGKFGFIVCRSINDISLFLSRCSDTFHDDRGLIIPLVDDDLIYLLNEIKINNEKAIDDFLMERYRQINLR